MKIRLVLSLALSFMIVLSSLIFNVEAKAKYEGRKPVSASFKEIVYLEDKGLLLYSADTFDTFAKLTASRNETISMIALSLNLDATRRDTIFFDIPKEYNQSGLIQSAFEKGIVTGYTDGTFKPAAYVTREELAVFIDRAYGKYLPNNAKLEFKDVPNTRSSYNSIKKLVGAGIAAGYSDGTFKPKGLLTKEELAIFMYRTITYLEGKGLVFKEASNTDYEDSGINWGMSYDSVYTYVKNNITSSTENARIITNRARYNLSGTTYYFFDDNNRLNYFWHEFDWKNEENLPNTVPELHNMYEEKVIEEFGVPDLTNTINNSSLLTYYSAWDEGIYYVTLETTKYADGKVKVIMSFFDSKKDKDLF
ncbi:S-layer homology domain-containing protein [Lysinibacillus fusiformis]|uniref:S-layer homology domain-containing protein n=1 Tax=Lysinibacillus fusiformis TaxID=28031 RepID=UPI00301B6708